MYIYTYGYTLHKKSVRLSWWRMALGRRCFFFFFKGFHFKTLTSWILFMQETQYPYDITWHSGVKSPGNRPRNFWILSNPEFLAEGTAMKD